jgi:hypothetical protein
MKFLWYNPPTGAKMGVCGCILPPINIVSGGSMDATPTTRGKVGLWVLAWVTSTHIVNYKFVISPRISFGS